MSYIKLLTLSLILFPIAFFSSCVKKAISASTRTLGEDMIVSRERNGDYHITMSEAKEWVIYAGESLSTIDWENPFLSFDGKTAVIRRGVNEPRLFFGTHNKDEQLILATERRIQLTDTPNFRDIGGIITQDNRMVTWGQIYRSGGLNKLTPADHQKLRDLDIQLVCDFRNNIETGKKPDVLPADMEYVQYAIGGEEGAAYADLVRKVRNEGYRREKVKGLFENIMSSFADSAATEFKPIVDYLLNEQTPIVYHCAGGKDRTGFMTAIILSALNVDRKTIKAEYLMSNFYREDLNRRKARLAKLIFIDNETLKYGLMVHEEYINAVFKVIDEEFDGIDNYLEEKFDMDEEKRQRLIDLYTIPLSEYEEEYVN